jgi:hypothetical protein
VVRGQAVVPEVTSIILNEPCRQSPEGLCCKQDAVIRKVTKRDITNGISDGVIAASVACVLKKRFKLANSIYSNYEKFQRSGRRPQRLRNTMTYSS